MIKACILLNEAIEAATKSLPTTYTSEVAGDSLREDELRQKITQAGNHITYYQKLRNMEYRSDKPNYSFISSLTNHIDIEQNLKQQLEEKLQKLLAFNASSPNLFSSIDGLYQAVQQGLSQARTSWNSETQAFTISPVKDMEWTKTVEKKWENREVNASVNVAENLSKEAGISYEDAYNFIINGILSDEIKENIDKVEKIVKTSKNSAYISSSFRYWLKHKDEWTKEMFKARTFGKGGAQIEDVKYVGKYLKRSKKLKNITSKFISYEHGRLNRDLKMMKENQIASKF